MHRLRSWRTTRLLLESKISKVSHWRWILSQNGFLFSTWIDWDWSLSQNPSVFSSRQVWVDNNPQKDWESESGSSDTRVSEQTGLSPALSFKGQRQKFNALSIFSHGASEKTCNSVSSKSHQEYDLHPDLIQYKLHTGDHVCVSAKLRQDLPVTRSPHQLPFPPSPLGIVVKDCF